MKQYKYTLLKQDGTTQDLGVSRKKEFKELYTILDCSTIAIIPSDYYNGLNYGRCTMYGDDEGRFNSNNHRNPHFKVLGDAVYGDVWDVVGNIVKEEVYKPVCEVCGKSDKTVKERECGYSADVENKKVKEVICDACEHEHCMDI